MFEKIAEILLIRALHRNNTRRGEDPVARFFSYVKDFRPTIAIETPYRDLREDIAKLVARGVDMPVNLTGPAHGMRLSGGAAVVLMSETSFTADRAETTSDNLALMAPIARGPHVGLLIVERKAALPQDVRDMIDFSLTIPRMDAATFWACSAALFPGDQKPIRARKADWIGYATPRDMVRTAAATRDPHRYLQELGEIIRRRLAQYTPADAPSLRELEGLGEARYRIEELAADIRSALDGKIGWDQVDRGYLLVGPPGTGKTTLVKALAKECGIRFILASASGWQERTSLGPHVQAIRSTFREARLYAPAILFIDEIDSLGTRVGTEAHNSQYQTVVINTVLEELQGFEGREGVIVIGATNNPESVDEAIRRPGRLDRVVEVPYPNVAALAAIYGYYLQRAAREGAVVEAVDTQRLAQLTFGRTGSHVEVYVRGAVRRARRNGGTVTEQSLVDEITARPPEGFGLAMPPDLMRRTAVHEAGHALVAMTGGDEHIPIVSIIPRSNGSLGFVARAPAELGVLTQSGMEESIRVTLGGRAAEEVVFGRANISGGSGGSGSSDLAQATQSVLRLLTEFGFSEAGGLLWIDWRSRGTLSQVTADAIRNLPMGEEILHEARRTADRLYAETIERLSAHRGSLDRVVEALIQQQELSTDALNELVPARLRRRDL